MSSNPTPTRPDASRLVRNLRLYAVGLVLLGFITALYICFTFYRMDRLDRAVFEYVRTNFDLSESTTARSFLERDKALLMAFLLDGRTDPEALRESVRNMKLEGRLRNPSDTPLLQEASALEDQWYSQIAHPLIEQRKAVNAHGATFEELLNQYHDMTPGINQIFWKADNASANTIQKNMNSLNRLIGHVPPHIDIEYFIVLVLMAGLSLMVVGLMVNLKKLQDEVSQGS